MWPLSISIVLQTRYGILVNKSTFRVEASAILLSNDTVEAIQSRE
jgi:hypothetical protein